MKKINKDFVRGAEWAMRRIYNRLPFNSGRCVCDCSADCVYYIEENQKILRRKSGKNTGSL